MLEYHMQEVILRLPENLTDRSINVFPMSDGSTSFNLVLSRDELKPAEMFLGFADRQVELLQGRLPQFAVTGRQDRVYGGAAGHQLDFIWVNEGTAYHQRQLLWLHDAPRVLIITATTSEGFAEKWGQVWTDIVTGMQPRRVGHA